MISRRTLLSSTVPAVGALGAAMLATSSAAAEHPDAELLALGRDFKALAPVVYAARAESSRLHRLWEDELSRRDIALCIKVKGFKRLVANELGVSTGYFAANDRFNDMHHRLVTLSEVIRSHVPHTLLGLAVWARAAQFEASDLDDPQIAYAESDCTTCQIHELVAHVERMAGEAP